MREMALWLSGAGAVLFSALMVGSRSLYVSAVCLLIVLMQAAVFFYASGAPLLAFLQVLIYAGAVMVLIVIAIMAAQGGQVERRWAELSVPRPIALGALALLALELVVILVGAQAPGSAAAAETERLIGPVLFGPYLLATEAVTLLLFLSALALVPAGSPRS